LARILLHEEPPQFAAADKLLIQAETALGAAANDSVDAGAEAVSPRVATRALVRQLQVISLAGQARCLDARALLQQLSTPSPAQRCPRLSTPRLHAGPPRAPGQRGDPPPRGARGRTAGWRRGGGAGYGGGRGPPGGCPH